MTTQKFHEIFSPTIMETEVSEKFIDIVNKVGDDVLSDDNKSVCLLYTSDAADE